MRSALRIRIAVPEEHVAPEVVDAALEAVTRLDEHLIRSGQSPTSHEAIGAGAIWRPEPPGDEHFDHGGTIAQRGWGDCDDWAPLHAATLRASGEDPGAVARVVPSGPSTYHAIVQRSDGTIEDPSIAAGMRPKRVGRVGGETGEEIHVWACDPHDGRIYEGSLAPAVGPLSVHCGPAFAVRGCHVVGEGPLYEARCDMPIAGSPLVHVRSYWRHRPRRHRHARRHRAHGALVTGAVPYALSCSAYGPSPIHALHDAIVGAVLCGDAAEMHTAGDRYKLLALQARMAGVAPGDIVAALARQIEADMHAAAASTGRAPEEHLAELHAELAEPGVHGFFDDVVDVAKKAWKAVESVPWGDIIHGAEAIVSVVPGLGTAVSDVLATAETAYETAVKYGHDPIAAALNAAYNYILASVPAAASLRFILDPVFTFLMDLAVKREPVQSAVIDAVLQDVPDKPKVLSYTPRKIAASLAKIVVDKLGLRNTGRAKPGQHVLPTAHAPAPAAPAPRIIRPIPVHLAHFGAHAAPHMAMATPHIDLSHITLPHFPMPTMDLARAGAPLGVPHAAMPAAGRPRPGSPGAPPGASRWVCSPAPGGAWHCHWA